MTIKYAGVKRQHFLGCTNPLASLALMCFLLAGSSAWAQVVISPTVVELDARQRVTAVTISLSKHARAPMQLQTELLLWKQDIQGEPVSEPTDLLLVTPPFAELQPGDKQVFRVALRGGRSVPEEMAFRLTLEDIAEPVALAADGTSESAIKFRMRYDLPVLLAPTGPVVNDLHWKPCVSSEAVADAVKAIASTKEACVRLMNAGNRRVKVQTLTLAGDNWQQALEVKDGENVLAGAEREWRVPLHEGQTGVLHGVEVKTARSETLQAVAGGF